MNKRLRSMIDEIFSELKMTAENLALRDELLSNAQARYEDAMAQGKTEEEAFCEIAASLEDVYDLLEQMGGGQKQPAQEKPADAPQEPVSEEEPAAKAQQESAGTVQTDLGDALSKAFTALGDFSQAVMPEAKKLYGQMDEATGGVLGKLGRAAKKGMRDAQKAAGEAIDKLSRESGELVFDFGANRESKKEEEEFVSDFGTVTQPEPEIVRETDGELVMDMDAIHAGGQTPAQEDGMQARLDAMEKEAQDLCAQAAIKEVTGDEAGAAELRMRAEALRMEASLLMQTEAAAEELAEEPAQVAGEPDYVQADGEIDEDAFARAVDDLARDAQEVIHQAAKKAQDAFAGATGATGATGAADYVVRDAGEAVSGAHSIPAAGLRKIDVQLDADDVEIVPCEGAQVETIWEAQNVEGEPAIEYSDHTLTIRRKNPDVFKTFFSVFKKEGGRITVRVPRGYAADYAISTTSGDVHIAGVDVDDVKITTTSGSVRVEPDAKLRAADIAVTTVSGHATVSACADTVAVTTVSGGQFVSCDAHKVDVNVVSGKVHVEGACDEWEVSSVSGEVELLCTVAPTKKVQISSVHGDVRLALPGEIRGFVAEATGALGCEIINEFGANRYGTCALPIRMETMHGKLLITRL
ncbi:MAG: DUF4097 family beta strand repeat protein [Clostridia bacterium]|nr:DUF4097 family beta strand repeat protein [Clostridia bacterium]